MSLVKLNHADTDKKFSILKLNDKGLVVGVEVYSEDSKKLTGVTSYPEGISEKNLPIDDMNVQARKKVIIREVIHKEMIEEEISEPADGKPEVSSIPVSDGTTPTEPEQPKSKKEKKKDGGN